MIKLNHRFVNCDSGSEVILNNKKDGVNATELSFFICTRSFQFFLFADGKVSKETSVLISSDEFDDNTDVIFDKKHVDIT